MNADSFPTAANANSQGLWIQSRTGSTNFVVRKNGGTGFTMTSTSVALPTKEIYILALNNNGSPNSATTGQIFAAVIGGGLSNANADLLAGRINAFATAVGANVY